MHIQIVPLVNVEDSVWFDHNYDWERNSFEETYQEAGPLNEEVFIIPDSSLLVTWLWNVSVMNYLEQVLESHMAKTHAIILK